MLNNIEVTEIIFHNSNKPVYQEPPISEWPEYEKPENLPGNERWGVIKDEDTTATIDLSLVTIDPSKDNNDVAKIIIGGISETRQTLWDHLWKASAEYSYTAEAGKYYVYKFEAWTESGNRGMVIQWYADNGDTPYQNTGYYSDDWNANPLIVYPNFEIDTTRREYKLISWEIPKSGWQSLCFQCSNQTGTFYLKIIEIREATPLEVANERSEWFFYDNRINTSFSISDDYLNTITINSPHGNISIFNHYTLKSNKSFTYTFEAQTTNGTYEIFCGFNLFYDEESDAEAWTKEESYNIDTTKRNYTFTTPVILRDGNHELMFDFKEEGTVYFKLLSITEN